MLSHVCKKHVHWHNIFRNLSYGLYKPANKVVEPKEKPGDSNVDMLSQQKARRTQVLVGIVNTDNVYAYAISVKLEADD